MKCCANTIEKLAGHFIGDVGSQYFEEDNSERHEQITEQISGGKIKSQESYEQTYGENSQEQWMAKNHENYEKYYDSIGSNDENDSVFNDIEPESNIKHIHEENRPEETQEKISEKGIKPRHQVGFESQEQITDQISGGKSNSQESYGQTHGDYTIHEETSEKNPKDDSIEKDEYIFPDKENESAVKNIFPGNSFEQTHGEKSHEESQEQTHGDYIGPEHHADSTFPDIKEIHEFYSDEDDDDDDDDGQDHHGADYGQEDGDNDGFYLDKDDLDELVQEDGYEDDPNDGHGGGGSADDHDGQDDRHGDDSVEFYVEDDFGDDDRHDDGPNDGHDNGHDGGGESDSRFGVQFFKNGKHLMRNK